MNRQLLFKVHLYLSTLFAPFVLMIAFSGTCYLMGFKGSATKTLLEQNISINSEINDSLVQSIIKKHDDSYTFEYLKKYDHIVYTRPMTRTYYRLVKTENGYNLFKDEPNLLKTIVEAHKGHGPKVLKHVHKFVGISLILVLISGMMMALMVNRDKKITLILSSIGLLILVLLLSLF
jgi:hypothetical protein